MRNSSRTIASRRNFALMCVRRLEQLAAHIEAFVERVRAAVLRRIETDGKVLQQQGIELGDGLRGSVVPLHHELARPAAAAVFKPELRGQRRLEIENQPVFPTLRKVVQPDAKVLQVSLEAHELPGFGVVDEAAVLEIRPACADAAGTADPLDHMQVAQSPGGLFQVGFERVRRVLVTRVPLLLLETLRFEVRRRVGHLRERRVQRLEAGAAAAQQTRLEQGRAHRDVVVGRAQAFVDSPHAVADLEAHVPEQAHQALEALALLRVRRRFEQDQHIDIRVGKQLAAAVAAGCRERGATRGIHLRPEGTQHAVDQLRMCPKQPAR
jgi:hypothetical protein